MKPLLITALLLSAGTALYAQQTPRADGDFEKKLRKLHDMNALPRIDGRLYMMPNKLDTAGLERYKQLLDARRLTQGGLVASTFSHQTDKGKVYNLSPDNMPCLVPDSRKVAVMPNGFKGVIPDEKMNAIPKVQIIPVKP